MNRNTPSFIKLKRNTPSFIKSLACETCDPGRQIPRHFQ